MLSWRPTLTSKKTMLFMQMEASVPQTWDLIQIVTKKNKIRIWRDVDISQRLQYTTMKHALKRILSLHRSNAKHR